MYVKCEENLLGFSYLQSIQILKKNIIMPKADSK